MKVVYCVNSLWQSGGTERVVTTKMNYLAELRGYEVHVVVRDKSKKDFFTLSPQIIRHCLGCEKSVSAYRHELEVLLMQLHADVAICVGGIELPFLWKLQDGSRKILEFHYTKNFLVNFVRGIHHIRFRKLHLLKVWLIQQRITYYARKYDCVVGLTQRDVHLWGDPANMTYIYNPLSFRSERQSSLAGKEIISVGSFTPAKGMDLLIEAFGRIAKRHADWHLSLFGSGQDYELLRKLISKYDIEKQVTLNVPCSHIADKLQESSIYAFPSRSDGFGLVLTEAMECGLPCVAFDCECGPREIIDNGVTGFLVPPQDINAFASALERLIDDLDLRRAMGENAHRAVARFYVENIMPQWTDLFTQLTERKQ